MRGGSDPESRSCSMIGAYAGCLPSSRKGALRPTWRTLLHLFRLRRSASRLVFGWCGGRKSPRDSRSCDLLEQTESKAMKVFCSCEVRLQWLHASHCHRTLQLSRPAVRCETRFSVFRLAIRHRSLSAPMGYRLKR